MDLYYKKSLSSILAIEDNGEHITHEDAICFSNFLSNHVSPRTLIFCYCTNSIGSLLGYTACIANKIVALLLDSTIDQSLNNRLIDIYRPSYLWKPISLILPDEIIVFSLYSFALVKCNNINHQLHDSLALLLTTSGSTGSPKLVRLSYENVASNARSIAEYLNITSDERPITTLPMHYSFGLSIINSHLMQGATLLLTNRSLMEKEFWQFLKNEQATSLSGVPYTFEMLKRLRFFRMDLPSLTTITQAGGKLSIELNKEFVDYCLSNNKRFVVMYGQTEATARMSYLPFEHAVEKLGSIGIAIPRGEFSLIDEAGAIISQPDQSGELVYKGANVSLGYAECANDLSLGDENNGVLYTGDIAKRDSENFFYIVGRKKRFIKIFGNRVNLDESERLLKTLIDECACIGTDDRMVVYITQQDKITEVKQFMSTKTGINHSAFDVRYCTLIPKNSSGKTLYANLAL